MSLSCRSHLAYVILLSCILSASILLQVDANEQEMIYFRDFLNRNRVKRQESPFSFDQIFQGEVSQNDFGDIVTNLQQGVAIPQQPPNVISDLIEAAAVHQTHMPQQVARTVMNSGLKR